MTEHDDELDRFATVVAATVEYVGREPFVLAHLERYFSPQPARLTPLDSDGKELQRRVGRVIERLGGPPRLIVTRNEGPKPRYDLYPAAAMDEVVNMFHRTRRSVIRAQMSMVGSHGVVRNPELFSLPAEGDVRAEFIEAVESAFWELAETAYIRLASYWDRVGQLLDFAFFGIRQFERDGFTAVVDRMRNNFVQVDTRLASLAAWKDLRAFQTSEKEDGLKWLLRRRNLLVHSLYLRPALKPDQRTLFDSEFNHIEASLRERLAPGTPTQELERMHGQLRRAAELFPCILDLCEHRADAQTER